MGARRLDYDPWMPPRIWVPRRPLPAWRVPSRRVCFPEPHAAIAFGNSSNSGAASVSAATVAITLPAGVASTDVCICEFAYGRSATSGLGSWTAPSGWTQVAAASPTAANSTSCGAIQLWWALGNASSLTWTKVGTVDFLGWRCASFSGVDNTTPIDATGTVNNSVNTGSLAANAVTVATDQAWELIGSISWNGATVTATSFTVLANYICRFLYNTTPKATGSTGTVSISSSSSSGEILIAQPFALRPGAAGGGGGPSKGRLLSLGVGG